MFQSQVFPCYVRGRINAREELAAQLGTVCVIVHANDSAVVEEPEVLRGQARVGLVCEIEDAHVLTGLHGAAIDRELVFQVICQWLPDDMYPPNPSTSLTKMTNTGEPGIIVWDVHLSRRQERRILRVIQPAA
jgi:hypothetical protein